jgi:hypothetical protein
VKSRFPIPSVLICAFLFSAHAQQPIRLAIVSKSTEVDRAADPLTAEFSKAGKVQLLERAEIARVYREPSLATGNGDYLKLGQILRADGLLFLGVETVGTNQFLAVDLVAVKPGVILLNQRFRWPLELSSEWAPAVEKRIDTLTPKLGVLAKDAVPISVVNLRSTMETAEAREAERQLTLLTIERLSQEPKLFVLERRRMESLAAEKELKGLDDAAFWDGSYLLDGTLDNAGYSQSTLTLTVRLTPPKGGGPVIIEVSGSRTNYSEVINRLTDKVLASLKLNRTSEPWNATEEADQFYAEAQWALKWNLFPQARAAAESAWALGKRNSDSAGVLFEAYTESVAKPWMNESEVYIHTLPDPGQFPLLARALNILSQNSTEFFHGSNSSTIERFSLGYEALFQGAGQLESYYYSAEARVGKEDQLAELRKQMREAFMAMIAHPMPETNRPWLEYLPQRDFDKLEWNEGGVCFDRPEDALPFYRQQLEKRVRPTQLPRLVGWTWQDRQRVQPLLHEFARGVCNDTNPVMRLEGLYLNLLLAPDDEQGSVARAQQELISAIWDNRERIFDHPEILSLLDRTAAHIGKVLYDEDQIVYHEPLSSFKQQMCIYFLQNAPTNNVQDLGPFFPGFGGVALTADQARELLPFVIRYQQKIPSSRILTDLVKHLTAKAGNPEPKPPVAPPMPAETAVEAKFIPWHLKFPAAGSRAEPSFLGAVFRNGQIWTRVGYQTQFNNPFPNQFSYLSVDPRKGVLTEIPFPTEKGGVGSLFEVSSNALFVESGGRLLRFRFSEKTWDEIPAPLEGASQMVWAGGSLFIRREDGLIALQPDSKTVHVLVSTRRKPPANDIDSQWPSSTAIYPQPDGKLSALAGEKCFTFDPATEIWKTRSLPPHGTNSGYPIRSTYSSAGGSQWLLRGPFSPQYLVGFWNNEGPIQSFLLQKTPYPMSLHLSNKFEPPRWDWPEEFPLEASCISSEDQKLWILCPRFVWGTMSPSRADHEPVLFSDNRQATLFCFEPEFRQPLSAAIHFEITSQSKNPFTNLTPTEETRYLFWERKGNVDFWMKSSDGFIFTTRLTPGHWFIPDTALKSTFEAQRQELRKSTNSPPKQASLEKP